MRLILTGLLVVLLATPSFAAVVEKDIDYKDGAANLKGTLVYDDAVSATKPGIVVFPEWWGKNDYAKRRARELAGQGYVVLAADMYGEGKVTADPKVATEWSKGFYEDRKLMQSRANAAVDLLKIQPSVDKEKIVLVGFCFGGTVALELARSGADIDGVGAFHAGLKFPAAVEKGKVKAKLLVLNGAADPMVPFAERQKFIEEMQTAEADLQFVEYGGAVHAFTNPDAGKFGIDGVNYDAKAEKRSFMALKAFLAELFTN